MSAICSEEDSAAETLEKVDGKDESVLTRFPISCDRTSVFESAGIADVFPGNLRSKLFPECFISGCPNTTREDRSRISKCTLSVLGT